MDIQYEYMPSSNFRRIGYKRFRTKIDHQLFSTVSAPNGATVGSQNTTLQLSLGRAQFYISDFGVSIVHVDWNKYDKQIEVHTVDHPNVMDLRKMDTKLFSKTLLTNFPDSFRELNFATLRGLSKPSFCKASYLKQLYCGCICLKPIFPAGSRAENVHNNRMIAKAPELCSLW